MMQTEIFSKSIGRIAGFTLALLLIAILVPAVHSQIQRTMTFEKGTVFMLPELGAVIVQNGDILKVEMVGGPDYRHKNFKDVDMEEADILMMLNGKKLKSIEDLKKAYDALEYGEELTFGIRRDKGMVMTSLTKTDMEKLGGTRMMMMMSDDDGKVKEMHGGSDTKIKTLSIGGEDGMMPVPALGLILQQKNDLITVANVLPNCPAALSDKGMTEGCTIRKIQGETISTAQELVSIFDKIKEGEEMTLTFLSNGKSISASFAKPAFSGKVIRKID